MSVHSVQSSQQAVQVEAVSQQKQATPQSALPQDKVTIRASAQAKQTASSIGAGLDHDGK